ncbi:MAG: hypothetical protein CO029_04175, partial [Candidatus Magasanikbacteria bacterium CG_4_9_14_0_2_um_filter_41_10]
MFLRKQTNTSFKKTIHSSSPDSASVLQHGDNYWIWHGFFSSYRSLKTDEKQKTDKKRLSYLRNQIIWYYAKNFFMFPIWFFSLLVPAYMKGEVNVWTNLKTMWRGLMSREFRPLRIAMLSQLVFLFFIVQFGVTVFYKNSTPVLAATYNFTQSSWSGSASTTA